MRRLSFFLFFFRLKTPWITLKRRQIQAFFNQNPLKCGRIHFEISQNKPQFEPYFTHFLLKDHVFNRKVLYASKKTLNLVYEMTQQPNQEKDQCDIKDHGKTAFQEFVFQGLKSGGSHVVASKSHGKTRLLFSMAKELRPLENVRVLAFDGSETWIYAFDKIPVFTISEKDILETSRGNIQQFEKYTLQNSNLVKICLETHKDILFRLKTRNPSKRGFFCRTIINFMDLQQRAEKATREDHENTKAIAYFLEEAQNSFNNRSTSSHECETFLTVFNEARNNKESFFTSSQRLNDFSKTIRSKQLLTIGKLSSEDISPSLRKIEKSHGLDFANMKDRTWFFEGQTFVSPEFKQSNGKPYQVNQEIKQLWLSSLPKPKTLSEKISEWFNQTRIKAQAQRDQRRINQESQTLNAMEKEDIEDSKENSQGDGLFLGDEFFPEEF